MHGATVEKSFECGCSLASAGRRRTAGRPAQSPQAVIGTPGDAAALPRWVSAASYALKISFAVSVQCIRAPAGLSENPVPAKRKTGVAASFIECMECLPVTSLPEGPPWTYEIKLDGFRLEAVKNAGKTTLYSRRKNVLNGKFPYIAAALEQLPDATVIDGEVVALDAAGRSDFQLLQNFRSAEKQIHFYGFDILYHRGKLLTGLPLAKRRDVLATVLPENSHISISAVETRSAAQMLKFVKLHGLEGVIGKRSDGVYEPGRRTGSWCKHRLNLGQEFVVGGYTPGNHGFDALIVGFYRGGDLIYAARVRAGFSPATRDEVFARIKHLTTKKCPFANLPELGDGRWGQGLTAEKMKICVWLKPEAVVRIDFLEWTGADHLRHTKYVAMRDDKDPRKVVRET
jgi:bifunctional non-homologous end joining protein LigD